MRRRRSSGCVATLSFDVKTRGAHAVEALPPFGDGDVPVRLKRAVQMLSIIPYAWASSGAM